ncbi:glycoside hydrolase family 13 protein [Tessaracoccus caeni]|uniref:glycoside hydrolase family 13 protein n=1 Tax=Tessaracoccus caeni TaxID=3031239 RepID=UPI0023DCC79D|nr:glycoside hydrolase family 13 protein [Tessaracoccus caeni]MDF1487307.1 glycoside hydrolase family 13 protein [Tessaracoccus caeni]
MTLLPHHDGSALYVSNQNPELGEAVEVRIRVPEGFGPVERVAVRSLPDTEQWVDEAVCMGTVDGWQWWSAQIVVANPRHRYRWLIILVDGTVLELTQAGLSEVEAPDVFDFSLISGNPPPAWMADAVMYQIVPDRFARSSHADENPVPWWAIPAEWDDPVDPVMPARVRQYYGGDLDGVAEKLDYLEELGVNLIYHTPIFPAGSNHRYDSRDFDTVDPSLGGDAAYRRLIEAVHARGMRIMGDLTANHSGDTHQWFQAAVADGAAPEADYYFFRNDDRTEYETWLGAKTLPKFDWTSKALRSAFIEGRGSVVAKWLDEPYNTDGWRIDVANMTGRLGAQNLNEDVRRTLRATMQEINPETLLVAEYTNLHAADFTGDAWHGAMSYSTFTRAVWHWLAEPRVFEHVNAQGKLVADSWFFGVPGGLRGYTAAQLVQQLQGGTVELPWRVRVGCMQALDSHDTARFATFTPEELVPLGAGLSMTLPGLPVVFAGDELGMTGVDGEASRTPMPWNRLDEPAIAERFATYRGLIGLRRGHVALQQGGLRFVHAGVDSLAFVRETEEESVLVVASRAADTVEIPAGLLMGVAQVERLFGDAELVVDEAGAVQVVAEGPSFSVWQLPGVVVPDAPEIDLSKPRTHRDAAWR